MTGESYCRVKLEPHHGYYRDRGGMLRAYRCPKMYLRNVRKTLRVHMA